MGWLASFCYAHAFSEASFMHPDLAEVFGCGHHFSTQRNKNQMVRPSDCIRGNSPIATFVKFIHASFIIPDTSHPLLKRHLMCTLQNGLDGLVRTIWYE